MKDKKGFTLVELLAVIAILAILMLIAMPNVLNLYRNARKNTFKSDVQNILRASEQAYVMNSLGGKNKTCFDSVTNPLDIDARSNLKYKVELSNKGKIINVEVLDNNYYISVRNEEGIKRDSIESNDIESRDETQTLLDCNGEAIVEGIESEPEVPTVDEYFVGSGTQEDPFKIQYIEDLIKLSERVKAGYAFENKVFKLTKTLNFNKEEDYKDAENNKKTVTEGNGFTPIGVESNYFKGNFDGSNYKIENLYIKNTDATDVSLGLFGKIENSTISNLTVSGSIENGSNQANVGMISEVYGTSKVINCTNEINITNENKELSVGGLVATLASGELTIENSVNKGQLSGGANIGGIIGGLGSNRTLTIKDSKNLGTISTDSTNIGGLIGYTNSETTITNSNNEGDITINSNNGFYVGGLVGSSNNKLNINNSHNKNTITAEKTENILGRRVGGLIGAVNSTQTSIITNSSNETEGTITGGNRVGGLVGEYQAGLIMNNCYNLANINTTDAISGNMNLGGLFGDVSGYDTKHDDIVILNSYNKGNIDATSDDYAAFVSGLIGFPIASNPANQEDTSTNTKIINSYNQGNITLSGNTTAALRANGITQINPKSVTLNNVYTTGVLNSQKENHIIGVKNSTAIANYKNVYYLDSLTGTKSEDTTNILGKSEDEMKNQTFVTLLNTNKSSVNLTEIDSRLTGYTLCDWKLVTSSYPELDCK